MRSYRREKISLSISCALLISNGIFYNRSKLLMLGEFLHLPCSTILKAVTLLVWTICKSLRGKETRLDDWKRPTLVKAPSSLLADRYPHRYHHRYPQSYRIVYNHQSLFLNRCLGDSHPWDRFVVFLFSASPMLLTVSDTWVEASSYPGPVGTIIYGCCFL